MLSAALNVTVESYVEVQVCVTVYVTGGEATFLLTVSVESVVAMLSLYEIVAALLLVTLPVSLHFMSLLYPAGFVVIALIGVTTPVAGVGDQLKFVGVEYAVLVIVLDTTVT